MKINTHRSSLRSRSNTQRSVGFSARRMPCEGENREKETSAMWSWDFFFSYKIDIFFSIYTALCFDSQSRVQLLYSPFACIGAPSSSSDGCCSTESERETRIISSFRRVVHIRCYIVLSLIIHRGERREGLRWASNIYISFFRVFFVGTFEFPPHTFYAALAELRLRFASRRNGNFSLWLNQQWILSAPTLFYFSHLTENMALCFRSNTRCRHVGHVNGRREKNCGISDESCEFAAGRSLCWNLISAKNSSCQRRLMTNRMRCEN